MLIAASLPLTLQRSVFVKAASLHTTYQSNLLTNGADLRAKRLCKRPCALPVRVNYQLITLMMRQTTKSKYLCQLRYIMEQTKTR